MLRRMSLTNFKCWREFDVELAPITLFFGTNSSGKTAILQSLLMLKQTAHGYDIDTHLNLGGGRRDYVALGSYRDIIFKHGSESALNIGLKWTLQDQDIEKLKRASWVEAEPLPGSPDPAYQLGYQSEWKLNETVNVSRATYELIDNDRALHRFAAHRCTDSRYNIKHCDLTVNDKPLQSRAGYEMDFERLEYGFLPAASAKEIPAKRHSQTGAQFIAFQLSHVLDRLRYIGPLRDSPRRIYEWADSAPATIQPDGANAVQMLIASAREDQRLLKQVERGLRLLGLVRKFSVMPIDNDKLVYRVAVEYCDSKNALLDVGFGVSQVLPVVTLLLSAPKGSIVLLEQPELHLHPNAQAALADLMLHAAETRGLQLIVESHSEHILRRLQRRIAEASPAFASPENIKMYFCQPGENGSTATPVGVDRFGQIANWPDKFLGDISGDIHNMSKAGFARLDRERERV